MLTSFGPEIWIADGPVVTGAAGFRFPTRMAAMRLASGGLFIWSPVALTPPLRQALSALGPVEAVIAPNGLHDGFVAEWAAAYPKALLHGAPGLAAAHPELSWAAPLGDAPDPAWAGEIDQVVIRGNRITTEVVFLHRASGTVIFTDLIQHMSPGWFRGWRAIVARLDLMAAPRPEVPRKFRLAFTDRRAARSAVRQVLAWEARAVLFAHGPPVTLDARATLRRIFAWLSP
ncbi:DUF4336 domain-containing protein [Jannaschia marina]|uniref:DUF4336 domain-containing protein n=1 Tax=Jannaschia marina TaxID=2741674 RepID=UPI0015CA5D8E|nr:DUF4336 domain-containing protein [Jannaschia marina]